MSEIFNRKYVTDGWKYKGICGDVDYLNFADLQFVTEGELIQLTPDVVINTSCEHMTTEWFNTVASNQLVIIQSNNNPDYEGHVNTCKSLDEFCEKYSLNNIFYKGELELPIYKRFMQIGFK